VTQQDSARHATRRWQVDRVEIAVDTAVGMTMRGRFRRATGSYEVGADGIKFELVVDATSFETGNTLLDGFLRSTDSRRLAEQPEVRFGSTRVRDSGNGRLRIEGSVEAAGKVETVVFDAEAKPVGAGLRLDAVASVDRARLGQSAERFAMFLPATLRVTTHLTP
jgi:polyisoprenoid-binding protein YceI